MSYGPAGYEDDDWDDDDDDQFDFGDHYEAEYTSERFYPTTEYTDTSKTSSLQHPNVRSGGFGSPSRSPLKGNSGRGRGKNGFASNKNDNFQSKKDGKKKYKNQGNFLFARTKEKSHKLEADEKRHSLDSEDYRAAIINGDLDLVVNVLNKGVPVDCLLKSGWTGLMHAASCGLPEVVNVLVERGANVNFQKDMFSVLMATCSSDCDAEDKVAECLTILIEKGAKINCHDRYHMTPLMYACRNGRSRVVEILLHHKPDINKQDQRGWTALGWAASRGHGRIVRMLLDEHANPKLYTNDGQSAEDLAYDGGFTIVADVLDKIMNPNKRMGQQTVIPGSESEAYGQSNDCVRYGDLELFLFGLELGHLVPLFQDHKITFDGFLQLTDAELQQIGVSQVGIRKKILTATHDVHTKEWDLSSLPSQSTNQLTSDDLNLVVANVAKHLQYIKCSIGYITKSLVGVADPTIIVQDGEHAKQFLNRTEDVLTEVTGISSEISRLQCSLKEISSGVPNAPADLIRKNSDLNKKQNFPYLHVVVVGTSCLVLAGLAAIWLRKGAET